MLQLDDENVRAEVISHLSFKDQATTRADLANYLLEGVALQWAIPEAEGYFEKLLSVPLTVQSYPMKGGRQKLVANYGWAVEGLSRFGLVGSRQLDIVRARLQELNRDEEDEERLAKAIETCIARLFAAVGSIRAVILYG